jgi:serine/threonine protein kinase
MSELQFGRYRVVAPIARGGMAEVFAGRLVGEGGFSRVVAIKSIRPDLIEDPAYVTMFLDEARLAANVQSQHVVHTFDLGRNDDGVPFMVMELVVGATIGQLIKACQPSPMPLPFALTFLVQSLRGLDDAHAALSPAGDPLRIVHRDLAPKNILVGVDGRARIMDFGIAHAVERLTRTTTGQIKGTVRYFSPEQADLQPLDQRSDIFSMGIVAYEMLTGKRLFSGRNMIEIYGQVMNQAIPDVREHVPDIPAELARVVAKALERDRTKRFQRALDFGNALAAHNVDPPDDEELRSFVRTHLPSHARELQRLLREDSALRTDVLTTEQDEAPPTVVTGSPKMSPLPPRPDAEIATETRGWWTRLMSRLFG